MTSSMNWFPWMSIVLSASFNLVLAAILAIGWKRHRRLGFLVLLLWTVVNLFSSVGMTFFMGLYHAWLQKLFPGQPYHQLLMIPHLCSNFIFYVMLGTGLALLVFRQDGKPDFQSSGA